MLVAENAGFLKLAVDIAGEDPYAVGQLSAHGQQAGKSGVWHGIAIELQSVTIETPGEFGGWGEKKSKSDSTTADFAEGLYKKYRAVCHGKDREGYDAHNAPSLRSQTLMATTQIPKSSHNFLVHTISYGRSGTAMAPYAKSQGGPLDETDIEILIQWLRDKSGVNKPIAMSVDPVAGDARLGKVLYIRHCTTCHGAKGEGISAPALANPLFLATASDAFIRHTIAEGRGRYTHVELVAEDEAEGGHACSLSELGSAVSAGDVEECL